MRNKDQNQKLINKTKGASLPNTKDSDWLLAKEKRLGVLDLEIVVLPWTMNAVVLEHIGLDNSIQDHR